MRGRECNGRGRRVSGCDRGRGLHLFAIHNIERAGIVLVTGDLREAMMLCDTVAVMFGGRIMDIFPTDDREKVEQAIADTSIQVVYNSNLVSIATSSVLLKTEDSDSDIEVENDLVYIFAGGELPTSFLQNAGIEITKRFGHIMKKHK